MTNNTKIHLLIFLFTALLFVGPNTAVYATTFYFDPVQNTVGVQQEKEIAVLISPSGSQVNAIEGSIMFPNEHIEVVAIQISDSIVDLWLGKPTVSGNRVVFAGIIPRGFEGVHTAYGHERKSGIIMSIRYKGVRAGSEEFQFEDVKAYINDGNASPAEIDIVPASLDVLETQVKADELPERVDDMAPEMFTPYVTQDPLLANSAYVVVFQTVDRGSGIDYYEVAEINDADEVENAPWKRAISPHVLKDQTGKSAVYVKAVDVSGNERVALAQEYMSTTGVQPSTVGHGVKVFLAFGVFLVFLFVYMFRFRKR